MSESLEIKSVDSQIYKRFIKVDGPQELMVATSSLNFFSVKDILYIASGVLDREGIDVNGTGFRYPTDELDPGEEPLEGVEIYNPTFGEIQLSISAFENFITRYFRATIVEVEKQNDSVIQESWWSTFTEITTQIEQRIQE